MGTKFAIYAALTFLLAIVIGAIEWLAFGFSFAIRYLYLSIGIVVAITAVIQAIRVWTRQETTLHSQLVNTVLRQKLLSSKSNTFRIAVSLLKEAALRVPYWPLELSRLTLQEKINRAPNLIAKSAVALDFSPRFPVITASWMLAINLVFLGLRITFDFPPGGAFQFYVTVCMFVTIIWFLDFFLNPIEVQLRQSGTLYDTALRFALVCILSLFAVVVLVYTYRLTTTTDGSFIGVLSDVLFAGRFNPNLKAIEDELAKSLSAGDIKLTLAALGKIDRSLFVSLAACILFYSTIGKRLWPILKGRGSLFRRTTQESETAANTSLQLAEFDTARRYAVELPADHLIHSMINLREAIDQRRFEDAYEMIEDMVNRARRQNKHEQPVVLDAREKWFMLASISSGLQDGLGDIEFVIWSVDRPWLELRDLGKFIVTLSLYGGAPQVVAFSHYLYAVLAEKGTRAELFRQKVVSRFLIGAWEPVSHVSVDADSFETSYIDYLAGAVQSEKVSYLLRAAPIYQQAARDLDQKTFDDYVVFPDLKQWADVSRFSALQSIDRMYVVDVMISLAELAKQSGLDDALSLSSGISDAKSKLEEGWGMPIAERLGMNSELIRQLGAALGSALK